VVLASLETARKLAPSDYRAQWFLASQFCQTNRLKSGMELMLAVENKNSWENLPVGFWDDYIDCSTQSVMPAHTLRAIDHAAHLGESSANYSSLVDIANKRYKSTDANTTYPAREAWQATEEAGKVQFTSQLCGTGFTAESDWHMDIRDVAEGTCISMMETHFYPSKSGKSSPTLVVLSRSPKPQEQLDDFVHSLVKKYPSARPITAPSCPSDKCLAFEILTDTMYQSDGGGHLLVVGFAEESPAFPGLEFEKPDEPPKSKSGEKVAYYHPNERLHRLPGTIYTAVQLDSNDAIFEKASADFRELLKSIRLD